MGAVEPCSVYWTHSSCCGYRALWTERVAETPSLQGLVHDGGASQLQKGYTSSRVDATPQGSGQLCHPWLQIVSCLWGALP